MRAYKVFILLLFFLITCDRPVQLASSVPDSFTSVIIPDSTSLAAKSEWIDGIFERLACNHWFNGAVIYSEHGHVIYKNAFGLSNFYTKDTLNLNSAFQLASVSKMITAMAVMVLKERETLDYDDTIQQFIPDFPYNGISIRMLLTHRSGLSRYMSLAHERWENKKIPLSNDDMIELFKTYQPKPYFSPDNGFHYCNTNYALLASIVEKASGMPFDKFVEKEIFLPLGMYDSFIYNMRDDSMVPDYIPSDVSGHRYRRWRPIRMRNDYLNGVMGDKGAYASVEDLFKFDQALNDFTLVSQETLQEAFTPGSPKYWRRRDNYGFGWRLKTSEDSTAFHFGWWKGFRAYYIRDMKQSKTIIVLSNKEKGPGSSHYWDIIRDTSHKVLFESHRVLLSQQK